MHLVPYVFLCSLVWGLFSGNAVAAGLAEIQVEVRDEATNSLVPARVYLVDSQGTHWTPAGLIHYVRYEEDHFVSPGEFQMQLPSGKYQLTVERGLEYRPWSSSLELRPGQNHKESIRLSRWIQMNRLGWYSGDLHNHRALLEMPALLLSEDLNLAPTLTDWVWEDRPISLPPQTWNPIRQVDATHVYSVLDKEVERLKEGPGAVNLLGLKRIIPFAGYRLFPPNSVYSQQAHAQGGYVDAEKIFWRDSAALAALQHIDFVGIVHNHFNRHNVYLELQQWGMIPAERPEFLTPAGLPLWAMEIYYRFLNCGFRLPVSAGSASGVMAVPLGYNRVYVKLGIPFSYADWLRALKAGRSFATNGPMLFLTVNGQEAGSRLNFPTRQLARLKIRAEALSAGNLDRIEVLFKGRVIKSVSSGESPERLIADFETQVSETGWVVARCFEKPGSTVHFAHTSPVYVQYGRHRGIVAADAQFFLDWMDREIEFYKKEDRFKKPSEQREMLAFFERARVIYAKLADKTK